MAGLLGWRAGFLLEAAAMLPFALLCLFGRALDLKGKPTGAVPPCWGLQPCCPWCHCRPALGLTGVLWRACSLGLLEACSQWVTCKPQPVTCRAAWPGNAALLLAGPQVTLSMWDSSACLHHAGCSSSGTHVRSGSAGSIFELIVHNPQQGFGVQLEHVTLPLRSQGRTGVWDACRPRPVRPLRGSRQHSCKLPARPAHHLEPPSVCAGSCRLCSVHR